MFLKCSNKTCRKASSEIILMKISTGSASISYHIMYDSFLYRIFGAKRVLIHTIAHRVTHLLALKHYFKDILKYR